jgi:hypothetical protein
MKDKKYLGKKEVEGKVFHYLEIGSEIHYRPTYIMWVSKQFVKSDSNGDYIEFPVEGCQLVKGKGKGIILKKGDKNLFMFSVECGFRGESSIDEVYCYGDEPEVYKFYEYHSPRGSTGIDEGVLVLTKSDKVKISWSRTGRLYGKPGSGVVVLYIDGRQEELDCVDSEELEMLEKELE